MAKNTAKTQARRLPGTAETEVRALGKGMKDSLVDTLGKGGWTEAWQEILGGTLGLGAKAEAPAPKKEEKTTIDSTGGLIEIFAAPYKPKEALPKVKSPEKPKAESRQEAAMNHGAEVKNIGEKAVKKQHKTDAEKIADLKRELDQVAKSASVRTEFAHLTLTQDTGRKTGKSDVSMLEMAIKMAKMSQSKTEDSNSWLKVAKGKRGGDFSVANGKMHQSGERTTVQNAAG